MRISIILLFTCVFCSMAESAFTQNAKVTINKRNASIKEVLNEIEAQTDYLFIYNNEVNTDKKVSVRARRESVSEVLNDILRATDIRYTMEGNHIILFMETEEESAEDTNTLLVQQQKKTITGKVVDINGEPIIGANIIEVGTTNGTVTDVDGIFSLDVADNAVIRVSYIGYLEQEVNTSGKNTLNITLVEDTQTLEEVVVVGYGTQKKVNLTGSVATVQSKDLVKAPVASTSNAITGRLPGVITKQDAGSPGQDDARIFIRGFGQPLVIVDGVEGDFNNIDANEIESISVLKDASAAIYGARAGNGVILVTTKRGTIGKPRITLNSSYTSQSNTTFLEPVSSGQYAEMQRQKWHELGEIGAAPFSEADIAKYYRGDDPDYPNTNWFDEVMRPSSPMHQHNLSLSGGNENLKYFVFLGYLNQQSFLKSNDGKYNRYNVRANLDANVTKDLSVQFDLSTIIGARKYPWRGAHRGGEFFQDLWNQQPIYEAFTPSQGRYPYAGAETSIVPETMREGHGYQDDDNQNFKGSLAFLYSVPFLQGLSAKAFVNYSKDFNRQKLYERPYSMYTYNNKTNEYIYVSTLNNSALNHRNVEYQEVTGQFSLNYEGTFDNHKVSALALYEFIDIYSTLLTAARGLFLVPDIDYLFGGNEESMTNYGSASETGRVSWIGRLNYSYKDKYLLESTIRRDASAKFAPDGRWGTFPSVSVGWRLSEENFIKNNFQAISNIKLRGGASKTGNDAIGNFLYLAGYNFGDSYTFGTSLQKTLWSKGVANPNLSWEEITIYNLGLDFGLWNNKLYSEVDVFSRNREGIAGYRSTSLPNTLGIEPPLENLNSQNTKGFEAMVGTANTWKGLKYDISANVSYSRAKWTYFDEPEYTDPDDIRLHQKTGNWVDRTIGFRTDGLFTSQEEIDKLAFDQDNNGNATLRPGDIKYVDLNKDGKLDWRDQDVIGKGAIPHWMFGLTANLVYENFDLSILFQGAFDYYVYNQLNWGIGSTAMYENRWTEKNNNPDALVPRLGSIASGGGYSDFYLKKSDYIRLKNLSFGYTLPENWIGKAGIKSLRFYVAGTNLFTLDKLKKYGVDPEVSNYSVDINQHNQYDNQTTNDVRPMPRNGYYYPQQRTITLGLNLTF